MHVHSRICSHTYMDVLQHPRITLSFMAFGRCLMAHTPRQGRCQASVSLASLFYQALHLCQPGQRTMSCVSAHKLGVRFVGMTYLDWCGADRPWTWYHRCDGRTASRPIGQLAEGTVLAVAIYYNQELLIRVDDLLGQIGGRTKPRRTH